MDDILHLKPVAVAVPLLKLKKKYNFTVVLESDDRQEESVLESFPSSSFYHLSFSSCPLQLAKRNCLEPENQLYL